MEGVGAAGGRHQELEDRVLAARNVAACPGDLLDHAQSPRNRSVAGAVQPRVGTNESIEKPFGTVKTIFVVVAGGAFSVGIARLYNCSVFASDRRAQPRVRGRAHSNE